MPAGLVRYDAWKVPPADLELANYKKDTGDLVMKGWRARIGFLVPPGNPTVEPEMAELTPPGVSLHFTRMHAEVRPARMPARKNATAARSTSIPACVRLLAMVSSQRHRDGAYGDELYARARRAKPSWWRRWKRSATRGSSPPLAACWRPSLHWAFGASPMPRPIPPR